MILLLLACASQDVSLPAPSPENSSAVENDSFVEDEANEVNEAENEGGSIPGNKPPIINKLQFTKKGLTVTDQVEVTVDAADPEGKPLRYDYSCEISGQKYPSETRAKLRKAEFKKGDEIEVIVTASDGESSVEKGIKTTVLNAPPEWDSKNPATMKIILDRLKNNNLQMKAIDPDGDKLVYRLEGQPSGMTISSTGRLSYNGSKEEPGGQYRVKIIAEDIEKAAVHIELPIPIAAGSNAKK